MTTRRWLVFGAAGWSGITVLFVVVHGLRRMAEGLPFYPSWRAAASAALLILIGAALSPLVVLAFRGFRVAARPLRGALPIYAGIGVAYWLAWASAVTVYGTLTGSPGTRFTLLTLFLRNLGISAFIALTLYAVIALVHQTIWHLEQARRREVDAARLATDLAIAETAALRARMNPDFIRDTLTAAADVMARDARAARTVLSNLSELLRVSLGRDAPQRIALRDEVRLAERFVRIQKTRLGEQIRVKLSVDEDVSGRSVSPLVLQPLLREGFRWVASCPDEASVSLSTAAHGEERIRVRLVAECPLPDSAAAPDAADVATKIQEMRTRLAATYGPEITLGRFEGQGGRIELKFFLA